MGQNKSKDTYLLTQNTHFSQKEIDNLRQNVQASTTKNANTNHITEDVFKETVKKCVPGVSSHDNVFLKRLYAAFDEDDTKSIDFQQFVDGLGIFMKGTPEEKLELSFKLYDVKHTGYLTRPDLERVMIQLSQAASDDDHSCDIKSMVNRMFDDLDVDDDGRLTFEEYKLSVMKEPLVVDFLEQFLAEHHISQTSRTSSVSSSSSSHPQRLSLTSSNTIHSSPRLSIKVSQAELLEYGQQQHSPTSSPTTSLGSRNNNNSSPRQHRLSRPTSMTSLDAAVFIMDLGHSERPMGSSTK
ncbi:hypothetical protein BC941DRAFT_413858 [Chlamydoabsidia padenii]|nr:hypothetical protein BC941DRAFT_413858 [Chlamydoabsidia padenii]